MTYEILKRPQAECDIEECFVYIAEDNLDKGVYFLAAVEDSIEQLSHFPFLGKKKEFKFQAVRVWQVKGYEKYLIFYAVKDATIEIIRLLHSARDIDEVFD